MRIKHACLLRHIVPACSGVWTIRKRTETPSQRTARTTHAPLRRARRTRPPSRTPCVADPFGSRKRALVMGSCQVLRARFVGVVGGNRQYSKGRAALHTVVRKELGEEQVGLGVDTTLVLGLRVPSCRWRRHRREFNPRCFDEMGVAAECVGDPCSVGRDLPDLDDFLPTCEFGRLKGSELLRRVGYDFKAEVQ